MGGELKSTTWQRNILWALALVLDLLLLVRLPETAKSSGRVERDIIPVAVNCVLAAIVVWPCLRLLQVGEPWQKVLGFTFVVLPVVVLVEAVLWVTRHS